MKLLIVFAAVVVAVLADEIYTQEQLNQLKTLSKECEESTHVDHEKLKEMRKRHFDDTDTHLKDYMLCMFKKLHWMDDEGHLKTDTIKKFLHKSTTATEAMEHCKDTHGSTAAETAYLMYKCYMEQLPSDYKYPM